MSFPGLAKELPAADRAVETARSAGKDKECPREFQAAEKMRDEAYEIYLACRTMPPSIDPGKCTALRWTSADADSASISPGIGTVGPSGEREVCPGSTTEYTVTATGAGGSRTASTTVTVKPPPPAPKVIDRMSLQINFDTDSASIRPADVPELRKAIDFIGKVPGHSVSIEGHTDSLGSAKYNQALSERRAAAVKEYLVKTGGADGSKIKTVGYGETRPIADNATNEGRFRNRRVEVLILSE